MEQAQNCSLHKYTTNKKYEGHPPFLCLASNTFPDVGSVGRIEKKKSQQVSE